MRFRWQARCFAGLALTALLFPSGCEKVLGLDGLTDLPADDAASGADAGVGAREAGGGGDSDATTGDAQGGSAPDANAQDSGRDGGDSAVRDGPTGPGSADASDSGQLAPGVTCAGDGDCASGHCADGVCCDTACTESCKQCNLMGYSGTCSPVAADGKPPASHGSCPVTAETTCRENGKCDGNGGCAKWINGTVCGPGSCDPTANTSSGSTCNGTGTCQPGRAVTCAPFKCGAAACASSCRTDNDCVGQPCVNGSCGKVANGSMCTSGSHGPSDNFAHGYLCDRPCSRSCPSCDLARAQSAC